MKRKSPLLGMILFVVLVVTSTAAVFGQNYPTKPIRMIVAFAPGGGIDNHARFLAQKLSESFGQSMVVDNRVGGSGIVGTDIVAKASPDGYTLIVISATHTIIPSLFTRLPYDAVKDFAPVTQTNSQPQLMAVNSSVAAKSVNEFIALAKLKPGQINYGSGGNGSSPHIGGELLKVLTGIDIVHVPYKGAGPSLIALISGEIALLFNSLPLTLPHVKTGKLRALAVTSTKRSPAVPELPTVIESGVPGFELIQWHGVLAPAKTPKAIVTKLRDEIVMLLQTPESKERLAKEGIDPVGNTPEEFGAFIRSEITKGAKVIKASGIRVD